MENSGILYHPKSALMVYEPTSGNGDTYIEYFDIGEDGMPMNAHPLTVKEAQALAKSLDTSEEASKAFLKPKGIIPASLLHINPAENGGVIWYTKPMERKMFFVDGLGIDNGMANVPALIWSASKRHLNVYAIGSTRKPSANTPLYHAPFFNIYTDGSVCMGSVNVKIRKSASLEEFIEAWESYFFNSYFSHLLQQHSPVKGNIVTLWKDLIKMGQAFPTDQLTKMNKVLKDLIL